MAYSKLEAHSEPWYIQTSGTFKTKDMFRILGYSEPWDIQTGDILRTLLNIYNREFRETANGYNYFRKL